MHQPRMRAWCHHNRAPLKRTLRWPMITDAADVTGKSPRESFDGLLPCTRCQAECENFQFEIEPVD